MLSLPGTNFHLQESLPVWRDGDCCAGNRNEQWLKRLRPGSSLTGRCVSKKKRKKNHSELPINILNPSLQFVPASDGGTFTLVNPHTRKAAAEVSEATVDDVNAAAAAAQRAFPSWSALSPAARGAPMTRLADLILEHKGELARLEAISMGKPVSEFIDAGAAAGNFRLYAGMGWQARGTTSLNTPGYMNVTVRQPFGVVGVIIPWNVPLLFLAKKVAPALAAGNTVVLKSSEKAPLTVRSATSLGFA
ncbi:hypothetical protein MPH_08847 [Macrophomina phaseolina MS6]|uniref:aldehyde dehydrogenase (NAD(+)) n=1 Tax=Macrophomina phaseolina (strain MS6) TaxID=1126212 RepID=K2RHC2_MACPH|nr:hypothetical protein MPH_08847 [Macrophomina phaseolina MS6]